MPKLPMSAIEMMLMDNVGDFAVIEGNKKFPLFDDVPVPLVEAGNDYDMMIEIAKKMFLIMGTKPSYGQVFALSGAGGARALMGADPSTICSSEKFDPTALKIGYGLYREKKEKDAGGSQVRDAKGSSGEAGSGSGSQRGAGSYDFRRKIDFLKAKDYQPNHPRDDYAKIMALREIYYKFVSKNWDTFGPAFETVAHSDRKSNYINVMLHFSNFISLHYELMCALYDEALEKGRFDVISEVLASAEYSSAYFPDFSGYMDLMGVINYNLNNFEEAIECWKAARERISYDGDEFDENREEIEQAIEEGKKKIDSLIDSARAKANFQYACQFAESHPEEAIKRLTEITPIYSDWWVYSYFMGIAHEKMGDDLSAISNYRRTIELNSGACEAYLRLAEIYMSWGKYEEAYNQVKEALSINPNNARGIAVLIIVSEKLEKLDHRATKLIENAEAIDPDDYLVREARELLDKWSKEK